MQIPIPCSTSLELHYTLQRHSQNECSQKCRTRHLMLEASRSLPLSVAKWQMHVERLSFLPYKVGVIPKPSSNTLKKEYLLELG